MEKLQNPKWNNAKFLLILLVVIGHTLQGYADGEGASSIVLFIYTFHMPAFIFLNGLFSKKTVENKRFEKVIPYFLLYFFIIFLRLAQALIQQKKHFSFSILDDTKYSWYMLVLPMLYIIAMFLCKYEAKYVLTMTIAVAVIAGYSSTLYGDYQLIGRAVSFLPFFMLGYYIDEKKLDKLTSNKAVRIVSAVILIGVCALIMLKFSDMGRIMNVLKGKSGYNSIKYGVKYGIAIKIIWYISASLISFCFLSVVPSIKTPLTRLGTRTLQVYVIHMPLNAIIMETIGLKGIIESAFSSYATLAYLGYAVLLTFLLSLGFITPFFKLFYKIKPNAKLINADMPSPESDMAESDTPEDDTSKEEQAEP